MWWWWCWRREEPRKQGACAVSGLSSALGSRVMITMLMLIMNMALIIIIIIPCVLLLASWLASSSGKRSFALFSALASFATKMSLAKPSLGFLLLFCWLVGWLVPEPKAPEDN